MPTKISPVGSSASGGAATEVTVGTTVVDGGVTNVLLKTDSGGDLANATGVTNASGKVLTLTSQAVGDEPLTIQLVASQSGNAIEIFNSAGDNVGSVSPSGTLTLGNGNNTANGAITAYYGGGLAFLLDPANDRIRLVSTLQIQWNDDVGIARSAAGIVKVTNGSTGAGALQFQEQTAPSAPAANNVYLYAEDNGSGKTRLMAKFATGAAQQVAIEP